MRDFLDPDFARDILLGQEAHFQRSYEEVERNVRRAIDQKSILKRIKEKIESDEDWKLFKTQVNVQIERRVTEVTFRPSGLDSVIGNIYTQGEIAGLKLALDFIDILIGAADELIKAEQRLLELMQASDRNEEHYGAEEE